MTRCVAGNPPFGPRNWDGFATVAPASWSPDATDPVAAALACHGHLHWLLRAATVSTSDTVHVAADWADAARRAVQDLNNLAGETLAVWQAGPDWQGCDGGAQIRLTPRARRLSVALLALRAEHERMLRQFGEAFAEDIRLLDRLAVRTSARNQFAARIVSQPRGTLREEIVLELAGRQRIKVAVTRESVRALDLRPGLDVVALIKASAVRLHTTVRRGASDRNRLTGTIAHIVREAAKAEVAVDIAPGLTGIALAEPSRAAAMAPGQQVILSFSPEAVIIGRVA